MKKNVIVLHSAFFLAVFLLFYAAPLVLLQTRVVMHLPSVLANYCFIIPQYALPFGNLYWSKSPDPAYIFSKPTAWVISTIYLILLSISFSVLTRRIKTYSSTLLLACGTSILAIFVLSAVLKLCGITLDLDVP